eukprot:630537-Alexandrium_andersonii.AAC.1
MEAAPQRRQRCTPSASGSRMKRPQLRHCVGSAGAPGPAATQTPPGPPPGPRPPCPRRRGG